jgi:hypothetical protein
MRVGVVGDLHLPFTHPMYLRFCQDTFQQWNVNHVHFTGDVVDGHALGFWDTNPNGMSANDEADEALEQLKTWRKAFPKATVSIGNHDERHFRSARKAGIPDRYIRDYSEVFYTPDWKWDVSHVIDNVLMEHGTGTSGKDAAINRAVQKRMSCVIGHVHCYAGVKWHSNDTSRIFGLNAGCGIDVNQYAFEYGKPFPIRPTLGCGIILDGNYAYFEVMPCGRRELYHRSRAGKA